jgi:hypothetical protein
MSDLSDYPITTAPQSQQALASVAVGHRERVDRPSFANYDKAVAVAEPSGERR